MVVKEIAVRKPYPVMPPLDGVCHKLLTVHSVLPKAIGDRSLIRLNSTTMKLCNNPRSSQTETSSLNGGAYSTHPWGGAPEGRVPS